MAVSRGDYATLDEFLSALGSDPAYQDAQAREQSWTPARNEQYETLVRSVMSGGPGSMGKNVVQQEMTMPDYGVPGSAQTPIDVNEVLSGLVQQNYQQNMEYRPDLPNSGDFLVFSNDQGIVTDSANAPFAPVGSVLDPMKWQMANMQQEQQEDFIDLTKGIDDKIKTIEAETDLDKRELLMIELASSFEETAAKKAKQIQEQVFSKYGVRDLEQQLQRSMALDASMDPSITKGKPSMETLQLAQQMKVAEAGVKRDLQMALKENPELEGAEAKVKNYLKYSETKIKQERIRLEKERLAGEKDKLTAEKQAEKDEIQMVQAGTRGIQIAKLLDPQMATDDVKAATWFNKNRQGDKEVAFLADNYDSPEMLKLAASDPKYVRTAQVLAHANAKAKAGDNQELYAIEMQKSKAEIAKYQQLINTPQGQAEAEKIAYPDIDSPEPSKATKDYITAKTLALAEGTAAEKQKKATQIAVSNAQTALDKYAEMNFTSNIEKWDPATVQMMHSSPVLSKVFISVRGAQPTGPISMEMFAGAIAAIPDLSAKRAAKAEFQAMADKAVTYHDAGVLGKAGGTLLTQSIINGAIFDAAKPKDTPWSSTSQMLRRGLGTVQGGLNNYLLQPTLAAAELPVSAIDVALNTPTDEYAVKGYFDRVLEDAFGRANTIVTRSQE